MTSFLAISLSYLIGSIPTGLWLGLKLRRVDIRQHGSKNIGATNTMRTLGKKLGAIALAGDAAKGLVAVLLFGRLDGWQYATRHGSGPNTRKKVSGAMVPAPTSMSNGC